VFAHARAAARGGCDAADPLEHGSGCWLPAGARRMRWWEEQCENQILANTSFYPLDAKDLEQLSRNKITHIVSIHESPQPLLKVGSRS